VQSFNDYFTSNHARLVSLWQTVVTFRRQFTELKAATDRELATLRVELSHLSRSVNSACKDLNDQLHSAQLGHQVYSLDLLLHHDGRAGSKICQRGWTVASAQQRQSWECKGAIAAYIGKILWLSYYIFLIFRSFSHFLGTFVFRMRLQLFLRFLSW